MSNDLTKLVTALETLLTGRTEPFRFDLKNFGPLMNNTPRRKYFDRVSDGLTCTRLNHKVGAWCIAEIEGADVQFNPVVALS